MPDELRKRVEQWLLDYEENTGPIITSPNEMNDEAAEILEALLAADKGGS
jgi:hypothetical protein